MADGGRRRRSLQSLERIQYRGSGQTQRHVSQHDQKDPAHEPRFRLRELRFHLGKLRVHLRVQLSTESLHVCLVLPGARIEFPFEQTYLYAYFVKARIAPPRSCPRCLLSSVGDACAYQNAERGGAHQRIKHDENAAPSGDCSHPPAQ